MLQIKTLGGLSLALDGHRLKSIGSRKAEAILVYLVVEGRQVSRDALAALFWPESSQEHAMTGLRVALTILRKTLGGYLEISRQTVSIKSGALIDLDILDLHQKLAGGHVDQALDLYQGDFLQGFHIHECPDFEDWLRLEQERLHKLLTIALHSAVSEAIDCKKHAQAQAFVQRLLELDPLDELAHQWCMWIYAMDGQRTSALTQYEKCAAVLQQELGIDPALETQKLYAQILRGEIPAGVGPAITGRSLPTPQTCFIGREMELTRICEMIQDPDCRLLTLVGPGGSGKTRLVLQAAVEFRSAFPDGIYFVPLESIPSPDYLVSSIAAALRLSIDTIASKLDPKTQLFDYLEHRSILFVLDGFEHLVGGARLLSEIVARAPAVQLLVTSRQRLDLKAEWLVPLEGLPLPESLEDALLHGSSAVRLFTERARQVNTEFQLSSQNYEPIRRICQLLEGMPLGIELAAAWTSTISSQEIADEMESSLDFLGSSTRDVPERHRSLRTAFEASWLLLTDEQQAVLSKLSVFQGAFDRHAAEQVAGASLLHLSQLLDRSLLRLDRAGSFAVHAVLREFSRDKLRQMGDRYRAAHDAHSRYYLAGLAQREVDILGPRMLNARDEINRMLENLRPAVEWACLYGEASSVRKMLISLLSFYTVQGWHEGQEEFGRIAQMRRDSLLASGSLDPSTDPICLSALTHQAFLLSNLGQIDESESISRQILPGLTTLDMRGELSACLHNLGLNASFRGEYEKALELLEEAVLLGKEVDYIFWPTYLLWLGHLYFLLGEYERGLDSLRVCYDLFDRQGTLWGAAFAISKMGLAADGLGKHVQALKYHQQALTIFERVGNLAGKGYSISRMSMSAYFLEDYPRAVQYAQDGYRIFAELGHRWGECTSLCRLGFAYLGLGKTSEARKSFETSLQRSRRDQMLPLSLYALTGLASTLVQEGAREKAAELYHYLKRHPATPELYLQTAAPWLAQLDNQVTAGEDLLAELEPIEAVTERWLR